MQKSISTPGELSSRDPRNRIGTFVILPGRRMTEEEEQSVAAKTLGISQAADSKSLKGGQSTCTSSLKLSLLTHRCWISTFQTGIAPSSCALWAWMWRTPFPEQLRLFAIDFARVNDFHCRFRHLDTELDAPEHHFQWNIHDFKIEQEDRLLVIELVGSGVSPMLSITCERYEIRPLAHEVLDRLFPKWRKPFGPLVRPGIEEMAFRQKQRRKR